MTEAEEFAAYLTALWAQYGGLGDPPKLIVSRTVYDLAIKAGFPAERMRLVQDLPGAPRCAAR